MVESTTKDLVLITGITGYIGSQVGKVFVDELINDGSYKLRASVRSLQNKAKLQPLIEAYGQVAFHQIEFVEADLNDPVSLANAIRGVQHIIHVASTIPGATSYTEKQMVDAARVGMQAIIDAAVENKVKKIIVTASLSTILGAHWKRPLTEHQEYDENDFAPYEQSDAYARSKITQERICREFLQKQKETAQPGEYQLEIVTLHPTFVIGPSIIPELNSSVAAFAKIIKREVPGLPNLLLPSVDVRDVALAHYLAFKKEGISGERILINQENLSFQDIGTILDGELRQFGYRVTTRRVGRCMVKVASWFDPQIAIVINLIDARFSASNKKSRELLGLEYKRDIRQVVIEMGYSLIEKGAVPDLRNKKKK